jgi:hypothetical protein
MLMASLSGHYNTDYQTEIYETNYYPQQTATVQCYIAGTANVEIQMRSQEDAPWLTVHTFTASGGQEIRLMPQLRVEANSVVGGDAKVWLVER